MKALLIEFDLHTGKRAGNINPRDPKLPCRGWQNLESTPAKEIRLVDDNRDLAVYKGVPGVTILDGAAAINKAIQDNIPARYLVSDMSLLIEHMKQKGLSLDILQGKDRNQIAKIGLEQGLAGVSEVKPGLVKE